MSLGLESCKNKWLGMGWISSSSTDENLILSRKSVRVELLIEDKVQRGWGYDLIVKNEFQVQQWMSIWYWSGINVKLKEYREEYQLQWRILVRDKCQTQQGMSIWLRSGMTVKFSKRFASNEYKVQQGMSIWFWLGMKHIVTSPWCADDRPTTNNIKI